ncbi:MAG TPA: thiosulfate oxidation carrier protein SoxY [Burkholderiaceae bacterium]
MPTLASRSIQRRRLLQGAGVMASLGMAARAGVAADAADPFSAQSFAELLGALGGTPRPSPLIRLDVPQIADNGAVVPVTVSSALPGTREILLLVDVNPQPLALRFAVPAGTEPFVATRIRMAASGTVYAAVRTDQDFYGAARAVEVLVGGCG